MYDPKRTTCESKLEQALKERQSYYEAYHWHWRENQKLEHQLKVAENRISILKCAQAKAHLEYRGTVE